MASAPLLKFNGTTCSWQNQGFKGASPPRNMKDLAGKTVEIPSFRHDVSEIPREILSGFGHGKGRLIEGVYEKIILILMDGLGYKNLADRKLLGKMGLQTQELGSAIPSSTPSILTTILTGLKPAEHGILGFQFPLPGHGIFRPVDFTDPFGFAYEVSPEEVMPYPTLFDRLQEFGIHSEHHISFSFASEPFTEMITGSGRLVPFVNHGQVFRNLQKFLSKKGRGFSFVYFPTPDDLLHSSRCKIAYQTELALKLRLVEKLKASRNADKTLVVLASDHGHVGIQYRPVKVRPSWFRQENMGGSRHIMISPKAKYYEKIIRAYSRFGYVFDGQELLDSGLMGKQVWSESRERMTDLFFLADSELVPYVSEHQAYCSAHGGVHIDEMSAFFGTSRLSSFEPKLEF